MEVNIEYRINGGWGSGAVSIKSLKFLPSKDSRIFKFKVLFDASANCYHIEVFKNVVRFYYEPTGNIVGADAADLEIRISKHIESAYSRRIGGATSNEWVFIIDLGVEFDEGVDLI